MFQRGGVIKKHTNFIYNSRSPKRNFFKSKSTTYGTVNLDGIVFEKNVLLIFSRFEDRSRCHICLLKNCQIDLLNVCLHCPTASVCFLKKNVQIPCPDICTYFMQSMQGVPQNKPACAWQNIKFYGCY